MISRRNHLVFVCALFNWGACASAPIGPDVTPIRLSALVDAGQTRQAVELCRRGAGQKLEVALARAVVLRDLRHQDPGVRASALAAARGLAGQAIQRAARPLLEDAHPRVRLGAALMLARTPEGAAVLGRLLTSPDSGVQASALLATVRLKGAATLPALICRATHRDPGVRLAAITGLGRLKRSPKISGLLVAALEDRHLGVRLAAVESMGQQPTPAALTALGRLAGAKDPYLALRAGLALYGRGEDRPLLGALARGLAHPRWTVRAAALNAVISSQHPAASKLAARALTDTQPRVRLAAARLLLSDRATRPRALRVAFVASTLACRAGTNEALLCVQAAEVLARAGLAAGMTTLERLARQEQEVQVRAAALRTALLIRPDHRLALESLADPGPQVRLTAAGWILSGAPRGGGVIE